MTTSNELKAYYREHPEAIPERVHGSYNGYSHYGCRCDLCREANRLHGINYRASATKEIPEEAHGTDYGYSHYGCRCSRCRQARADYHYEHRTKPRLKKLGKKIPFRPNLAALELMEAARNAFQTDTEYAIAIAKKAGQLAQGRGKLPDKADFFDE